MAPIRIINNNTKRTNQGRRVTKTSAKDSKVTFKKDSNRGKAPKVSFKKLHSKMKSDSSKLKNKIAKVDSTPIEYQETSLQDSILKIRMNKSVYGNYEVTSNMDSGFTELGKTDPDKDVTLLFKLYEELFYDIPLKNEENSHETLFLRSREYMRGFVDPKDSEIESLVDQVEDLTKKIIELEAREPVKIDAEQLSGVADAITDATANLSSTMNEADDLDDDVSEMMTDENNDGIDDSLQRFSAFGTPRRLILEPPDDKLRKILANRKNKYYKDKFYGRQIYKFKKKVKGKKGRYVIYDGARGKKGKRYLIDLEDGESYKIRKNHWKGKHRDNIFQP